MSRLYQLFFLVPLFTFSSLCGEVISITVNWDPTPCDAQCNKKLERGFNRNSSVRKVEFNSEDGEAVLYWRPNQTFRYSTVKRVAARIGLPLQQALLEVRGTISRSRNTFYLNSIGDQTRIELFSKEEKKKTKRRKEEREETQYSVSEKTEKQLTLFLEEEEVVTLQGTLIAPDRSPYQMLITDDSLNNSGSSTN